MSGGTTQQSGTSTSVNQIPQWMTDAGEQNYGFAQQVAEQPLQQYQGQMVADVAPQTQQSWDVAANSGNVGADQYAAGSAGYLGALSQTPMQVSAGGPTMQVNNPGNANAVTAGQLSNTNLSPYMDPYTQDVINATMPGMLQANALSQNQQGNAANSANAFGGSRQGIQQGVAQAQGAMNVGQMLANLNNQNFTQAQAAATGDINRNLQAQTTNQQSQQTDLARQNTDLLANQQANANDLNRSLTAQTTNQTAQQQKINSDILASQGLTNTGDSMNKADVANYGLLSSAGAGESMQQQNDINAQMAKFSQAFNYPQQQLGTLLSSLGMTPHDTSTSGQTTSQTTTPTDWAGLISGGIKDASSLYGMMPSDKRLKKDIEPAGQGPAGIPVYKYRFKGALAGSPKQQGPMAQDVQKVVPQAVSQIPGSGGKLQIHMPTLSAATEPRGYASGTPFVLPNMTPASDMGEQSTWRMGGGADSREEAIDMARPELKHLQDQQDFDRAMGREPRHYAAGTPFVQPSLAAFVPPSSPGVAKGIGAMSAFRPPMKLPRGATVAPMPKRFAGGSADVQPGPTVTYPAGQSQQLMMGPPQYAPVTAAVRQQQDMPLIDSRTTGRAILNDPRAAPMADPRTFPAWKQFANGSAQVPGDGSTDTVPSYLTPGEAVLTPGAAQHVGRPKIAALNAMHPPVLSTFMPPVGSRQATTVMRAGARGMKGALSNTKLRPKIAGGLSV